MTTTKKHNQITKNTKLLLGTAAATAAVAGGATAVNADANPSITATAPTVSQTNAAEQTDSIANAQADVQQKQATVNDAQAAADNTQAAMNQAQDNYNQAQTDVNNAQNAVNNAQNVYDQAQQNAQDATPENISQAQDQVNTDQTAADQAQQAQNAAQAAANQAQKTVDETAQDLASTTKDEQTAQSKADASQKALDDFDNTKVASDAEVNQAQTDVNNKQAAADQAQTDLDNANHSVTDAQAKANDTKTAADKAKSDLDAAKSQQSTVQNNFNQAQTALDQAKSDGTGVDVTDPASWGLSATAPNSPEFKSAVNKLNNGATLDSLTDAERNALFSIKVNYTPTQSQLNSNILNIKPGTPVSPSTIWATLNNQQKIYVNEFIAAYINAIRQASGLHVKSALVSPNVMDDIANWYHQEDAANANKAYNGDDYDYTIQQNCNANHGIKKATLLQTAKAMPTGFYTVTKDGNVVAGRPMTNNPNEKLDVADLATSSIGRYKTGDLSNHISYANLLRMISFNLNNFQDETKNYKNYGSIYKNYGEMLGLVDGKLADKQGTDLIGYMPKEYNPNNKTGQAGELNSVVELIHADHTVQPDPKLADMGIVVGPTDDYISDYSKFTERLGEPTPTDPAKVQAAQKTFDTAKTALDQANAMLSQAQKTYDNAQSANTVAQNTLKSAQDAAAKAKTTAATTKQALKDAQTKLQNLKDSQLSPADRAARHDALQKTADKDAQALKDLQEKVKGFQQALIQDQQAAKTANDQLTVAKAAFQKASDQLTKDQQHLADLQNAPAKLDQAKDDLVKAQAAVKTATEKLQAALKALNDATKANDTAQAALKTAKDQLSQAQGHLAALQAIAQAQAQVTAKAHGYHIVNNQVVDQAGNPVAGWHVVNGQMVAPDGSIVEDNAKTITPSATMPSPVNMTRESYRNVQHALPQTNGKDEGVLSALGLTMLSFSLFGLRKRRHN